MRKRNKLHCYENPDGTSGFSWLDATDNLMPNKRVTGAEARRFLRRQQAQGKRTNQRLIFVQELPYLITEVTRKGDTLLEVADNPPKTYEYSLLANKLLTGGVIVPDAFLAWEPTGETSSVPCYNQAHKKAMLFFLNHELLIFLQKEKAQKTTDPVS